jgi:uncharacterized membrane protein
MPEGNPAEHSHHAGLTASEHKTIGRVESFGDIVFGFSLFNLAINLRVPATSSAFVSELPQFAVFLLTFAVLCSFWWMHHRMFKDFFKPDGAGLVLNFAFLASVALFTYPLQLYMKFGFHDALTVAAYAAGNLLLCGFVCAMTWKGLIQLGPSLSEERRVAGYGMALRTGLLALAMLLSICLYPLGHEVMAYPFVAAALIAVVQRRFERSTIAKLPQRES